MGYAGAWLAPRDGGEPDVTAGIPAFEDEHASLLAPEGSTDPPTHRRPQRPTARSRRWTAENRLAAVRNRPIGGFPEAAEKQMEPNRVSIRLFGDVLSTTPK
ncbi:hypothetical protein GCM10018775_41060 [Streptomyces umbrinus]|nr:hypothetical protein GCM10018775_41060 [Streptomyces umbrinus]